MVRARNVELAGGAVTALSSFFAPLSRMRSTLPAQYYFETAIQILIVFIVPGVLVAYGAYAHAVQEKSSGRKLLWVLGVFYILVSPFLFLASGYAGGFKTAFLLIMPSLCGLLTLLAAVFNRITMK